MFNLFKSISLIAVIVFLSSVIPTANALGINVPAELEAEKGQVIVKSLAGYPGEAEGRPFQYAQYIPKQINMPTLGIIVVVHGTLAYETDDNGNPLYDANGELVMHTIEDNAGGARGTAEVWKQVADEKQYMVIAPYFDSQNFGGGATPCNHSGCRSYGGYRGIFGRHYDGIDPRTTDADGVLNQVIDSYHARFPGFFEDKFYLTGHSAGGQFVSRYIFLHPERIASAVIGSAGFVPFPDDSIAWPDGMAMSNPLYLRWSEDQTQRSVAIDPPNENFEIVAKKRITAFAGELEVHNNARHNTSQKAKQLVHDLRKDLLNDPAEGIQLLLVGGIAHDGRRLSAEKMSALLPEVRSIWNPSGGQDFQSLINPRYQFNLSESKRINIELASEVDSYLYLIDSTGNLIAEDDNSGEGTNAKIKADLQPGAYRIVAATKDMGQESVFSIFANIPVTRDLTPEPMLNGHHLDACYEHGNCSSPIIANEWCRLYNGKDHALIYTFEKTTQAKPYTTERIGDGLTFQNPGYVHFTKDVTCGFYSQLRPVTGKTPPIITNSSDNVSGRTITVTGTATDLDGDLATVKMAILGTANQTYDENGVPVITEYNRSAVIECSGTTNWSCSYTVANSEDEANYKVFVYAADQEGQISPSTAPIERFLGESCEIYTDTVANHKAAGRAYSQTTTEGQVCWGTFCWGGTTVTRWYANGSNEDLGTVSTTEVTLYKTADNYYETTGNCSTPAAPVFSTIDESTSENGVTYSVSISDADNDVYKVELIYNDNAQQCVNIFPSTLDWECNIGGISGSSGEVTIKATDLRGQTVEAVKSFSIIGPVAPVVTVTDTQFQGDDLVITGSAADANGNLDSVLVGMPASTGAQCSMDGDFFTCYWDITGAEAGQTITVEIAAVDTTALWSDSVTVEATVSVQHAPVISSVVGPVIDGTTVTFTGTAYDLDEDLESILMVGLAMPLTCSGTEDFNCTASGLQPGTYSVYFVATDAAGNQNTPAGEIEFTIDDLPSCFTATNADHAANSRAYMMYNILYYAEGSATYLGLSTDTTSLQFDDQGNWNKVTSCP